MVGFAGVLRHELFRHPSYKLGQTNPNRYSGTKRLSKNQTRGKSGEPPSVEGLTA
jgi:hypothetical protein